MPSLMVTDQSALFELDVETRHWTGPRRVACFRGPWKGQDCFFLAATKHLTFPMTLQTLYEHSSLILAAGTRETVLDRYFDEDGRSLRDSVAGHLDVVHSL